MPAALFSAAAVLLAALVKGAISFGFPPLATPLLALVMDVKSAIAVLIIPNIVMDAAQLVRLGAFALVFVAMNLTRLQPVVPEAWARWLAPPVGVIAGVIGGVTNGPGLPLV